MLSVVYCCHTCFKMTEILLPCKLHNAMLRRTPRLTFQDIHTTNLGMNALFLIRGVNGAVVLS